eukprot:XP_014005713.1 PREDICTED: uncharacterized protein LOC106574385 isoform X2 [Salmo salar]
MVWLRGSKVLSLLLTVSLCLCVSPSLGTGAVELKYTKTPMFGTESMPLRLTCKAEYDTKQCGRIDAFWCHHTLEECPKLIDPGKYLTVVNEMLMEDHSVRHRHIVTDFIQLTPADQGVYQCNAVCEMGGHTAMGHYINITVEAPIVDQRKANNGGLNWTYSTGMILWSLFLILELLEARSITKLNIELVC